MKAFIKIFVLLSVLIGWCLPTIAATTPTASTPVVVIMDGYSQRITTNSLVNAGVSSAITNAAQLNGGIKSTLGAGTYDSEVLSAVEWGGGFAHQTILTLPATEFALTDDGSTGHASLKLYDMPAGYIQVMGASTNLACTSAGTFGATGTAVFSIGSTATTDATLSTTDANIVASTSTGAFVASAGTMKGGPVAAPLELDGHTTAVDVYLNIGVATDPAANSVLTCSGPITITWISHGDN